MKLSRIPALLIGLLVAASAGAVNFPIFNPGPSGPVKSNGTYTLQAEVSADIVGLWTGTCSASTFLRGDGACATPATTPGGSSGQIQFNNSGVLGGNSQLTWNSTTGQLTAQIVGLNAPTTSDPVPIIQGAQFGEDFGGFPGNYYSDAAIGYGYNTSFGAGGIALGNAADWSVWFANEQDYAHQALPLICSTGANGGTATSGTTTTVLTDSTQNLVVNCLKSSTLYDVTRGLSSIITANTATTITVSPAIAGMASTDTYQVLRRDGEFYSALQWPGAPGRFPGPYNMFVDKGTSLATNKLHLVDSQIPIATDNLVAGFEMIPDVCNPGACGALTNELFDFQKGNLTIAGHFTGTANIAEQPANLKLYPGTGQQSQIQFGANNRNLNSQLGTNSFSNQTQLLWNIFDFNQSNGRNFLNVLYPQGSNFQLTLGESTDATAVTNIVGGSAANTQANGVPILTGYTGTTASIGGGALTAGACTTGTATVTGATTAMAVAVSPAADPGTSFTWEAFVSAANTVTVRVCALLAATPTATTYNIRVLN